MKKKFWMLPVLLAAALSATMCSKDNEAYRPSAAAFRNLQQSVLDGQKQHFSFNAGSGTVTLTSARGVTISIDSNSLTQNGAPVTSGTIDLEFTEIFDSGTMAATNRPTHGFRPDGTIDMLISGGEFLVRAFYDEAPLDDNVFIVLNVPTELTGEFNPEMTQWTGVETDTIDEKNQLIWQQNMTGVNMNFDEFHYIPALSSFGWTNVDCFYSDPRPKTTLLATAPSGYNFDNSSIYLRYEDQPHALASLDKFENGYFSEHYGQIPIGLHCQAIFVTEDNGKFRYAIKPVTIVEGGVISFLLDETATGTAAELIAAINAS